MIPHRSSGILAHITSLPSPYGIGDIGTASYDFLTFLDKADQMYWQFLPITPTRSHFDDSPYMSHSAFAGNPLLLSPDLLFEQGFISKTTLENHIEFSPYLTEFAQVRVYKKKLLLEAFNNFVPETAPTFQEFVHNSHWVSDYALFMGLKEVLGDSSWSEWPEEIRSKKNEAMVDFEKSHSEKIQFYLFEQYLFYSQWELLKIQAQKSNIQLFGDLPIYVSFDSVDVWANQDIFLLDNQTCQPTVVAGVPPDYFSKTGQRWGNPLYDWQNQNPLVQNKLFVWWTKRLQHLFRQVDVARIDHFRAFESYWAIPEEEETAVEGEWLKGPGADFFNKIFKTLGPLRIIAEDLGIITPEVTALRDELQFPGMKVLQFAFDGNLENDFLPFNFTTQDCVVYTGTHDNDTTVGWFLSDKLTEQDRTTIKALANRSVNDGSQAHRDLIYLAQSSIGKLCILPLQDVLGFGNDCKMNSPGVPTGNWRWRCAQEFLTEEPITYLKETTSQFGRSRKTSGSN